jgi:hypothetical protein
VDKRGFDHFGNLLIGKDLATMHCRPVLSAGDSGDGPASGAHVSQALNLSITSPRPSLWTMVSPLFHHRNDPLDAFRRGQCALGQHDRALGVYDLRQSIAAGYSHKEAYTALAAACPEAGNAAAEEAKTQADNNLSPIRPD